MAAAAVLTILFSPAGVSAQTCHPAWTTGTSYAVGALASYSARNYACLQAHTSQAGWEPPAAPSLWQDQGACTGSSAGTVVSLSSVFNVNAAYSDGSTFPAAGGLDGVGSAYSSNLLGSSLSWSGAAFSFGPANQPSGARNRTVSLPAGQFGTLWLLGTGVNGDQLSQTVRVNYTDGTSSTFTQTFSNWLNASQNVAGQTIVRSMAYRNKATGVADNRVFNLYGYAFALASTKTVSSLVLPANNNVSILAATLGAGAAPTATATARPTPTATATATARATATPTTTPAAGCAIGATCEAETALLGGGVVTSTLHAGYTGSGFADYQGNGTGFVEWTVSVPSAGAYTVNIRYANGGTADRPLSIQVNGTTVVSSLSFPVTGWTTWTVRAQGVSLPAGSVRIRATELPNGPNVDNLVVTGGSATPTSTARPTATATATTRATATATPRATATATSRPTPTVTATPTPTATARPTATAAQSFRGYYKIVARHSGRALNIEGASVANEARVIQWAYDPAPQTNDEWELVEVSPGAFRITARHSGLSLNIAGASLLDGAAAIQWPYEPGGAQNEEWVMTDLGGGYWRIANVHSGKALEVAGASAADGGLVQQQAWTGATHQQWQLVRVWSGYHRVVARHSGKALNIFGNEMTDGADVIQWPYVVDGQYNDEWEILELGTGFYRLTARSSLKVMQVAGGATTSGANVDQSTWASGNHQQWAITDLGGGYYRFTPRHATGMALNVTGASTADAANVDQATWSGATSQQWEIVSVNEGPGLSKVTFAASELFTPITRIQPTLADGTRRGFGLVTMHKGWLATVPATDSGNPGGSFSFYDFSNPRAPVRIAQRDVPSLREQHGFVRTAPGSYGGDYCVLQSGSGIEFWDWSDVRNPVLLSAMALPGVAFSDYDVGSWWLAWQAPYVYVAASGNGIHIVDATNPRSPIHVKQIPTSQTGGFRIHSIFAVGNLLVASSADTTGTSTGILTMDISDPANPTVLRTQKDGLPINYSTFFNGNKIIGSGFMDHQVHVWDITNPASLPKLGAVGGMDRPAYATFQDGHALIGDETSFTKVNITNFTIVGRGTSGEADRSEDIPAPLGNVVLVSNDHAAPSAIIPHVAAPDNTGPSVNMVHPPNNATNQRVSSRVGITLTDWIELRSVNNTTFIVRPLGGAALHGKYSGEQGILNFWPNQPLLPGTTYEVVVPAGGIKDFSGNGVPATFTSRFTTAGTAATPPTVQVQVNPPTTVGTTVTLAITGSTGGPLTYSWDFGDGTVPTAFSSISTATHAYAAPGHYSVVVTARNSVGQASSSYQQAIHHPLPTGRPNQSGTLGLDGPRSRMWVVNPDADTVTAISTSTNTKVLEQAVGVDPRSAARAPDGTIWVVNRGSGTISVLNGDTGAILQTITLPFGSQPFGLAFAPSSAAAYVATEGSRQLLRLDPAARTVTATLNLGFSARGVAVSQDSARIFVTRFVSPANRGEIVEVSASTFTVARTFALALDTTSPDGSTAARGLPNYISTIALSPDGRQARVPSKKDNILRGQLRDGQALSFETTVRAIVSYLDLTTNTESFALRTDFNDRDLASAAVYSPRGDYVFVATQGTNTVEVFDAYDNRLLTGIPSVGLAPQGLALSADGRKLFVQNFLSRNVGIYDVTGIVESTTNTYTKLADVATVATEKLAPTVLRGKQIFYNASDRRMNLDGYISCASCHLDGGQDGRVWDFTDRGEGLRNTIALVGRRGMGHGRVHWSANFDEIQDFEHDIRAAFGGTGFLSDAQFNTGTRNTPLGDPKAGLSSDLDALAAFVASLNRAPASPYRNANGTLTASAVAGRTLFQQLACNTCHGGADFTDSASGALHDVGTIKASSGRRLGQTLTGLDTPTLKGLWATGPYLHDGSAATLLDVLTTANPSGLHGSTASLTAAQRQQLVDFLLQIDETEPAP
jgi:DNA-binding beta-propeller fold protein YncE